MAENALIALLATVLVGAERQASSEQGAVVEPIRVESLTQESAALDLAGFLRARLPKTTAEHRLLIAVDGEMLRVQLLRGDSVLTERWVPRSDALVSDEHRLSLWLALRRALERAPSLESAASAVVSAAPPSPEPDAKLAQPVDDVSPGASPIDEFTVSALAAATLGDHWSAGVALGISGAAPLGKVGGELAYLHSPRGGLTVHQVALRAHWELFPVAVVGIGASAQLGFEVANSRQRSQASLDLAAGPSVSLRFGLLRARVSALGAIVRQRYLLPRGEQREARFMGLVGLGVAL